MTICDACRSLNKSTEQIIISVEGNVDPKGKYTLDICKKCKEYISIHSLLIGIREQRNNE